MDINKFYSKHFDTKYPKFEDTNDKNLSVSTCLIAMTPRSGSTMLLSLLEKTGVFGKPGEYLNSRKRLKRLISKHKVNNFKDLWSVIHKQYGSEEGVLTVKATYKDFYPLIKYKWVGEITPNVKFIYLIRRDIIAQAISLQKAKTSSLWHSRNNRKLLSEIDEPVYNLKAIENSVRAIVKQRVEWELFFTLYNTAPLRLEYEEIVLNPLKTITDYLGYMNLETNVAIDKITPNTIQLSDDINKEWRSRFLSEFQI